MDPALFSHILTGIKVARELYEGGRKVLNDLRQREELTPEQAQALDDEINLGMTADHWKPTPKQ